MACLIGKMTINYWIRGYLNFRQIGRSENISIWSFFSQLKMRIVAVPDTLTYVHYSSKFVILSDNKPCRNLGYDEYVIPSYSPYLWIIESNLTSSHPSLCKGPTSGACCDLIPRVRRFPEGFPVVWRRNREDLPEGYCLVFTLVRSQVAAQ